jgi:threonine/homoserine/homoserine lactone efflux protein
LCREKDEARVFDPQILTFIGVALVLTLTPGADKSLLLAAIHFTLGVLWLSLVAIFLGRVRVFVTRSSVRRGLEAVTGTVLIAFGIRLALTQR